MRLKEIPLLRGTKRQCRQKRRFTQLIGLGKTLCNSLIFPIYHVQLYQQIFLLGKLNIVYKLMSQRGSDTNWRQISEGVTVATGLVKWVFQYKHVRVELHPQLKVALVVCLGPDARSLDRLPVRQLWRKFNTTPFPTICTELLIWFCSLYTKARDKLQSYTWYLQ